MKNFHLLLVFSLMVFTTKAGEGKPESLPQYRVTATSIDNTLKKTEAVFAFTFVHRNAGPVVVDVKYSYNGTNQTAPANKEGLHTLKVKPGKYKFQFWYNASFYEVYTDSISIKAQEKTGIEVYFDRADVRVKAAKPVIYLYPQEPTAVSVQLALKGHLDFSYPAYQTGWNITANPDGTLQQGDKTYGYLFWEGLTEIKPVDVQKQEGFVVEASALTGFFEEKLAQLGLNGKEIQDYITYWVPRLQTEPRHFIRFLINEDFNKYATLTITPQPDHVLRVFMLSTPLNANENIQITAQELPTFTREGFTVIEWGGTVLPVATSQE